MAEKLHSALPKALLLNEKWFNIAYITRVDEKNTRHDIPMKRPIMSMQMSCSGCSGCDGCSGCEA